MVYNLSSPEVRVSKSCCLPILRYGWAMPDNFRSLPLCFFGPWPGDFLSESSLSFIPDMVGWSSFFSRFLKKSTAWSIWAIVCWGCCYWFYVVWWPPIQIFLLWTPLGLTEDLGLLESLKSMVLACLLESLMIFGYILFRQSFLLFEWLIADFGVAEEATADWRRSLWSFTTERLAYDL